MCCHTHWRVLTLYKLVFILKVHRKIFSNTEQFLQNTYQHKRTRRTRGRYQFILDTTLRGPPSTTQNDLELTVADILPGLHHLGTRYSPRPSAVPLWRVKSHPLDRLQIGTYPVPGSRPFSQLLGPPPASSASSSAHPPTGTTSPAPAAPSRASVPHA